MVLILKLYLNDGQIHILIICGAFYNILLLLTSSSYLFLNMLTFVAIFTWSVREIHIGTDRCDQKLRRCSVLARAGGTTFRCPLRALVGSPVRCASLSSVKNDLYPTESCPPRLRNIWIMSPLSLRSTRVVSPRSLSFSSYLMSLGRVVTIPTARLCTFSRTSLSLSVHGLHAWLQYSSFGRTYVL